MAANDTKKVKHDGYLKINFSTRFLVALIAITTLATEIHFFADIRIAFALYTLVLSIVLRLICPFRIYKAEQIEVV
jgi:hypothetical protein